MKTVFGFRELVMGSLLWAGGILAALAIPSLVLADDHSICGPWGCGPSTDALVAMHLAWIAAIWPPLFFLPWRLGWSRKTISRLGALLAIGGFAGVLAVVMWQWIVWRPTANEFIRPYTWQRCGFVLAGAVDWPTIQALVAGIVLWVHAGPRPNPVDSVGREAAIDVK
ncbi:hypothetical protein FF011L_49420 [Roseimaritima multifibrata]|uniref:Uncharacterized protein n=1 Tax=Roseimaritima multifibrata TaxID=1930274 RepID=A0A517MMM4_9BACT|nr:hypothetical protein [Roseimaritima multifibrata]QDS96135.1 hypothetical protein FF011L_49420 [Roseimaritima multifibrata]